MLEAAEVARWLSIRQLQQLTRHHPVIWHLNGIDISVKVPHDRIVLRNITKTARTVK